MRVYRVSVKFKRGLTAAIAAAVLLPSCLARAASATDDAVPIVGWRRDFKEGERLMKTKEYEKAESCFRQAYKDAKKSGADTDDLVMCMEALADVIYKQDTIEEPLPLYKKSLRLLEKKYGKDSPRLLFTLTQLAAIYEGEGDYKKAVRYIDWDCDIAAKESATSRDLASSQHRLGRVRFEQGQLRKAEESYISALTIDMQDKDLPADNRLEELLADYMNLLLRTQADEKILRSSFQIELLQDRVGVLERRRAVAASSWSKEVSTRLASASGGTQGNLPLRGLETSGSTGGVPSSGENSPGSTSSPGFSESKKAADFASLESLNKQRVAFYERMIASDIDSLGAEHPSVARDLGGLATLYLTQKRYDEAKPLLERALKIYEKAYPDGSGPVKDTRLLLAAITEESTSVPVTQLQIETLPSIPLAAQTLEIALRLNDIAFMLYSRGKMDYARKVYNWALASTLDSTGPESVLSASCMNDFSRVLRITGSIKLADEMRSQALVIMRRDRANQLSRLLPGGRLSSR
ncbi:MAG: tetratricopeptide repeat protein [Cyanobacteria bacterium]|nr:tetratricopeptide repeat protein [Cyanobacteriota bacterium]